MEGVESETDEPLTTSSERFKNNLSSDENVRRVGDKEGRTRRDADVLTKVIVCESVSSLTFFLGKKAIDHRVVDVGIGWLATVGIPMLFVRVGLSV